MAGNRLRVAGSDGFHDLLGLVGRVRPLARPAVPAYYRNQIPYRRTVMAVSVSVPARQPWWPVTRCSPGPVTSSGASPGSVVVVICLAAAVLCWLLGTEAVRRATHWAEHTTGQW